MRHLLGGVAFAALLAAGLPAAAQTNGAASANPPPAASDQSAPGASHHTGMSSGHHQNATSGTSMEETGTKHKKHAAKHGKTMKMASRHQPSPADNKAEQLNREELERVQQNGARMPSSGSSTMPNAGTMPGTSKQPSNGTPFPNAGANTMPGTVTSGASPNSRVHSQQ